MVAQRQPGTAIRPPAQIGIYAEPGLSYFPDNGSRLQNYFKDKPITLNLQLGLRMNIGRW